MSIDGRHACRRVHLVADPGVPFALAREVAPGLAEVLARRLTNDSQWAIDVECARIPADDEGRIHLSTLAAKHWTELQQLVVCITDQPRRDGCGSWPG